MHVLVIMLNVIRLACSLVEGFLFYVGLSSVAIVALMVDSVLYYSRIILSIYFLWILTYVVLLIFLS